MPESSMHDMEDEVFPIEPSLTSLSSRRSYPPLRRRTRNSAVLSNQSTSSVIMESAPGATAPDEASNNRASDPPHQSFHSNTTAEDAIYEENHQPEEDDDDGMFSFMPHPSVMDPVAYAQDYDYRQNPYPHQHQKSLPSYSSSVQSPNPSSQAALSAQNATHFHSPSFDSTSASSLSPVPGQQHQLYQSSHPGTYATEPAINNVTYPNLAGNTVHPNVVQHSVTFPNSNGNDSSGFVTPTYPAPSLTTPVKRRSGYRYPDSPSYTKSVDGQTRFHPNSNLHSKTNKDFTSIIELQRRKSQGSYVSYGPSDEDPEYMANMIPIEKANGGIPPGNITPEFAEEEDSPFPEVCASVSNIDDPDMPCMTFRSLTIGLFLCTICSAMNFFFSLRYPTAFISPILVQVLSYPMGKAAARLLPISAYTVPNFICTILRLPKGTMFSFNPGPFNIKEHTIIILMANTSLSPAFATTTTLVLDKFFHLPRAVGFDILLILSVQVIGFSFAGFCRRFLVWPANMIWPQNLVTCTLLNTFHAEEDDRLDGSISRFRFFVLAGSAAFFWYFLPGYLFTGLSAFSWLCWIFPTQPVINQLFGVVSGMGMSAFTFDWSQIAYIGSPLITPWWAEVNIFVGFVFFYWILTPILYYSNTWNSSFLPIYSSELFDRFGNIYDVDRVLNQDLHLNVTAYEEYSPLYISATFACVYSAAFALSLCILVHVVLYHGKGILQKMKNVRTEPEDIHMKLMRNYPEVPDWWYGCYLLFFVGLSIVAIEVWNTGLPVWGLLVALLIAAIYMIPGGMIYAMTATQITINLVVEIVPGVLLPGRAIPNLIFKAFGAQSLSAGLSFVTDLKLGHYMKIPPRSTFIVQVISAVCACLVQVAVKELVLNTVPDLCEAGQNNRLTCPQVSVAYTAAILWGVMGPSRQFGIGTVYHPLLFWLLVGALLPVPFWFLSKRYPNSWIRYIHFPVLLTGIAYIPPATGINYSSWFIVGFISQYYLRRKSFRWWSKYNFVLSASLEGGTTMCSLLVYLVLQMPRKTGVTLNWWGNDVYRKTLDYTGSTYRTAPTEGFGPLPKSG